MTGLLTEGLNNCYSLMFTGENFHSQGCYIKALLCYENCRVEAEARIKESVFLHCYVRAARKEAQVLLVLGLRRRAYKLLKSVLFELPSDFHSLDKFLILSQYSDVINEFSTETVSFIESLLEQELRELSMD